MSSGNNAQKLPLNRSLNMLAHRRALDVIARLGQALPCTVVAVQGSIVTVKCEVSGPYTIPQLTVPKAESQWLRTPTQVGDHGVLLPTDSLLNAVSGQGGAAPNVTSLVANLSALAFLPIGSKSFPAADDPNAALIYGPNGAVIRDSSGASKFVLTPSGIIVTVPGSVAINGNLTVTGAITAGQGGADQVGLQTHKHGGVATGGGTTAAPTAGT
jgi:hypothetical protein